MLSIPILAATGHVGWADYLRSFNVGAEAARREHRERFERTHPNYTPVAYPPLLFHPAFCDAAADTALRLLDLCVSLPERIFDNDYKRLLAFQGLPHEQADLLLPLCTPRFIDLAAQFSRPDLLVCRNGLKAVEVNVSAAIGGLGLCDRITGEFRRSDFGRYLQMQGVCVDAPDMMRVWHDALMRVSRRDKSAREPVFFEALVTPSELQQPYSFHSDFVEPIRRMGYRVETGLLQRLRVTPEGVFHGDVQVDIVYTMFAYGEILAQRLPAALFHQLAVADLAGLVDFVSPPVGAVFDNKANFELLTSAAYTSYFSSQEREFIGRHVPRTWRLNTTIREEVRRSKDAYVLKPAGEFGGRSVCVGQNVSEAEWTNALDAACTGGIAYVVQERVADLWPCSVPDSADASWAVCLGPTLFGGRHGGTLIRQAPTNGGTPVINGARGALVGTAFSAQSTSLCAPTEQTA